MSRWTDARFKHVSNGFTYWLMPQGRWMKTGPMIKGAFMYHGDGAYVGYWPNFNMPLELLRAMRKWVVQTRILETGNWEDLEDGEMTIR
jgi:hypothetical protein